MKTEKNIFIAFILNLAFSVFEFAGGISTGSVAIISDALHDMGDAASIGISYFLEKKSKQQPDDVYTYGYARYSVLGSVITTLILLVGSIAVIIHGIKRIMEPVEINDNGMMILAIVGVGVNFGAALLTRGEGSMNQKAVNLHMLEDVLGWIVVLVGAIVMKLTGFMLIDPLMSIGVAIFILVQAGKNLKEAVDLFLEKTPRHIRINELKKQILEINGITDVHHIHIWSMDGQSHYATLHIVTDADHHQIKEKVRAVLQEHGITHTTLEPESEGEPCDAKCCHTKPKIHHGHHH